jgi:hypothetical protein
MPSYPPPPPLLAVVFARLAYIQDTAVSRPEIQRIIDAYEAERTDSAQYRTTGTVLPFPEDWVPVECLAYFGQVQALVRVLRCIAGERVKRRSSLCRLCSFRESTFLGAELS